MYSHFQQNLAFPLVFTFLPSLLFCTQMEIGFHSHWNISSNRWEKLAIFPNRRGQLGIFSSQIINKNPVSLLLNKQMTLLKKTLWLRFLSPRLSGKTDERVSLLLGFILKALLEVIHWMPQVWLLWLLWIYLLPLQRPSLLLCESSPGEASHQQSF